MAKLTVLPPPPPPVKYVLEMSEREARLVRVLIGGCAGDTFGLYEVLTANLSELPEGNARRTVVVPTPDALAYIMAGDDRLED